jgi:hypothetical protein
MPFDVSTDERMYLLGSIGTIVTASWAWLQRRGRHRMTCEQKLTIVMGACWQMANALEMSLLAPDLPAEKQQRHMDRARELAEEAKTALRTVQGVPDFTQLEAAP